MNKLRDALIVVVLSGVVLFFAVWAYDWFDRRSVGLSIVVQEAELACINDGVICHVGYDSFSSVADAQAYLDSPEHLAKVKERERKAAEEADFKKRVDAMVKQGASRVRSECRKDGNALWYCNSITDKQLEISVASLLRERDRKIQSK